MDKLAGPLLVWVFAVVGQKGKPKGTPLLSFLGGSVPNS